MNDAAASPTDRRLLRGLLISIALNATAIGMCCVANLAHADTIYLCESSDTRTLFWSSASCVGQRATLSQATQVATGLGWEKAVELAEATWAKAHGAPVPPRPPRRPPSGMAPGQCHVFQQTLADLDARLSGPPSAPHMHDALRLARQEWNDVQLEMCGIPPTYSTAPKYRAVVVDTTGKSCHDFGPTDGPAVDFKFPASDGMQLTMQVLVSMRDLKGRYDTGAARGVYTPRFRADLCYVGFPCNTTTLEAIQGYMTISSVTSESIEGSWNLVLESGQPLTGPFKTVQQAKTTACY